MTVPAVGSEMVPAEEFSKRLPPGWGVLAWRTEVESGWQSQRTLFVKLTDGRVAVEVVMTAAPDWDWLTALLQAAATMPPTAHCYVDPYRPW